MKHSVKAIIFLNLLGTICFTPLNAEVYRWVDKEGRIHFSDQVPPSDSQVEREVYSESGRLISTIEAAKTEEQLEEEKKRAALEEEKRKKEAEQMEHDKVLLGSFPTEQDLVIARDDRIAAIESLIRISEEKLEELDKKIKEMEWRAEHITKQNKPLPKKLTSQIDSAKKKKEKTNSYIDIQVKKKSLIEERFAADIKRYRELMADKKN